VLEPISRGVLDRPVKPGDDSLSGDTASHSRDTNCPSHALRFALCLRSTHRLRRRLFASPPADKLLCRSQCQRTDRRYL